MRNESGKGRTFAVCLIGYFCKVYELSNWISLQWEKYKFAVFRFMIKLQPIHLVDDVVDR